MVTNDIKLIAIDLDGTLLDSDKKISPANQLAIQKAVAKGIRVVLCTGRPKAGIKPYFEQLGLTTEEFVIGNNGCTTYQTSDWTLVAHHSLTEKQLDQLYEQAQFQPQPSLVFMTPSYMYVIDDEVSEVVARDAATAFDVAHPTTLEAIKLQAEPVLLGLFMDEDVRLDRFQSQIQNDLRADFHVVRGLGYVLEAMPLDVNKASSLERLIIELDIKASQVMAIGDAANDLEMLDFAGLSVAMGNADQSVKDLADYVTLSNDQAGVAHAIERFVLTEKH